MAALFAESERVRRVEAILNTERELLERCVKGESLEQLLDRITGTIIEHSDDMIPSILLLNGGRLRHGSAPTLPPDYVAAIDGARIGPMAGSCGTAAFRNAPVYASDIASDPRWTSYQALALQHGLRACWSTPIRGSDGQVLATFALYHREPKLPSDDDLSLIDRLSRTTALVLEWRRSEEHRRTLLHAILDSTRTLRGRPEDRDNVERALSEIERKVQAAIDTIRPLLRDKEIEAITPLAGD